MLVNRIGAVAVVLAATVGAGCLGHSSSECHRSFVQRVLSLRLEDPPSPELSVDRIAGGEICPQFGVAALVRRPSGERDEEVICSAALIHPRAVLTAAHCVNRVPVRDLELVFASDVHSGRAEARVGIGRLLASSEQSSWCETGHPDLAILVLERAVGSETYPISSVEFASEQSLLYVGFGVDGFGRAGLRHCAWMTGRPLDGVIVNRSGTENTCPGDSGGAVLDCTGIGGCVLRGIVSRGDAACVDWGSSVDVGRFRHWIYGALFEGGLLEVPGTSPAQVLLVGSGTVANHLVCTGAPSVVRPGASDAASRTDSRAYLMPTGTRSGLSVLREAPMEGWAAESSSGPRVMALGVTSGEGSIADQIVGPDSGHYFYVVLAQRELEITIAERSVEGLAALYDSLPLHDRPDGAACVTPQTLLSLFSHDDLWLYLPGVDSGTRGQFESLFRAIDPAFDWPEFDGRVVHSDLHYQEFGLRGRSVALGGEFVRELVDGRTACDIERPNQTIPVCDGTSLSSITREYYLAGRVESGCHSIGDPCRINQSDCDFLTRLLPELATAEADDRERGRLRNVSAALVRAGCTFERLEDDGASSATNLDSIGGGV